VRNGSFLVLRRLTQDVAAFYRDTDLTAQQLTGQLTQPITGAQLRTRIVGRAPSGQPLMRPVADPTVPEDMLALNHFGFLSPSPAIVLSDETHIAASATDPAPFVGLTCPVWSHIRKVNPRDLPTNLGGPDDTASFQMLRRGIPFGPAYDHGDAGAPGNQQERGLMFVAYQTSISTQFENLNSNWMNTRDGPADGGFDLLVGQHLEDGLHAEKDADFKEASTPPSITFPALSQWVTPTGGAYLFAPGLEALQALASTTSGA
jgi:Dyp-type peroxidase family